MMCRLQYHRLHPRWQAFIKDRWVKKPESVTLLKRTHLYFPFCPSCPPPRKTMAFPFYCCTSIPSTQYSISLVNGHYHLSGCKDCCPGKAITAAQQTLCLFPECKTWEKNKTILQKDVADKQITRKWESLPCIMISSIQQLRCHPVGSDTQGMQVHGSWKRKPHRCIAQGLWFHMPAVGVWIPTSKTHTKVAVFPQTRWLSCSMIYFFFWPEIYN